jgi:hypothetical protein
MKIHSAILKLLHVTDGQRDRMAQEIGALFQIQKYHKEQDLHKYVLPVKQTLHKWILNPLHFVVNVPKNEVEQTL